MLTVLAFVVNMAWDHPMPKQVTYYELWTWVNGGQVENHRVDVLPSDQAPFSVTKEGGIGDAFSVKVRACNATQCSKWTETLRHVVTETQVITIDSPTNIRIEVIVK